MLQGREHQSVYPKIREQELMRSGAAAETTRRIKVVSIQVSLAKLRAFALSCRCDRNTPPRTGCTDCTGEIIP